MPVARKTVAQVVNAPCVPSHKLLPGRAIAPEAMLHKLSVLLQLCMASLPAALPGLTQWNANCRRKVPPSCAWGEPRTRPTRCGGLARILIAPRPRHKLLCGLRVPPHFLDTLARCG